MLNEDNEEDTEVFYDSKINSLLGVNKQDIGSALAGRMSGSQKPRSSRNAARITW